MNNAANIIANTLITLFVPVEVAGYRLLVQRDWITITDLENAGKRGKMVRKMAIEVGTGRDSIIEAYTAIQLLLSDGWDRLANAMDGRRREVKSYDIAPAGFSEIRAFKGRFSVRSGYDGFSVRDRQDPNETTIYCPDNKANAKKFRHWVEVNMGRLESKSISQIYSALRDSGIKCDTYCAMD